MNMNRKKVKFFLIIFIVFNLINCKNNTDSIQIVNSNSIPQKIDLENRTKSLISYIINKDIDGITRLLPDNYNVKVNEGDVYRKKIEIKNSFLLKGHEYIYLFDSKNLKNEYKNYTGDLKEILCMQDQLKILKLKNLSISQFFVIHEKPFTVNVNFIWDGIPEPKNKINFCCFVFQYIDNEWKLVSLVFNK